jgi:hypothetical protein
MNAETRPEIERDFAGWIGAIESCEHTRKGDDTPKKYMGITYVPDPYGAN